MKIVLYTTALCLISLLAGISPAQGQAGEGYTFITGERGPQICVGRWIPPRDVALPGVCEGQIFGLSQLSAISGKQTVDRLDQLFEVLTSIDQRLAVGNDQMNLLLQATENTQSLLVQQGRQAGEVLQDAITRRFDDLPTEILANDLFKDELARLKEDILEEVEKRYSPKPAPPQK